MRASAPRALIAVVLVASCNGAELRCDPSLSCSANRMTAPTGTPIPPPCVGAEECEVRLIAAGGAHTCATLTTPNLYCWGRNDRGQTRPWSAGEPVAYLSRVRFTGVRLEALSLSRFHSCVRARLAQDDALQTIYCFGSNATGMLGQGSRSGVIGLTSVSIRPPPDASMASPITHLASGTMHGCLSRASGDLECWGSSATGAFSAPTRDVLTRPTPVLEGGGQVYAGGFRTCYVQTVLDRRVLCVGQAPRLGESGGGIPPNDEPVLWKAVRGANAVTSMAMSAVHACALDTEGAVLCWGENTHGELGDGTRVSRDDALAVPGLEGVLGVCTGARVDVDPSRGEAFVVNALGPGHTCAVRADRTLLCWGANDEGQLGDGTTVDRDVPTLVPGIDRVRMVACGGAHTCALRDDGRVWCWGRNADGELGVRPEAERRRLVPGEVTELPRE